MDATTLINATAEPVHELSGAFCFAPGTAAIGERLGLDVFMFYCLGRGGVLGDVDADQVVEAFAWFRPSIVETQWNEGRAIADPAKVATAYLGAAHVYAESRFTASDTLRSFNAAAECVVAAAPVGRWAIFDGYRSFELPGHAGARAYQLVLTLAELRAGAHAATVRSLGLPPTLPHYLDSFEFLELYGLDPTEAPPITDDLIEQRAVAEDATTTMLMDAYAVLDDVQADAFADGVRELSASVDVAVEGVAD